MKSQVKILRASAGSGKTYRLSYEYVRHVVQNPALYRRILAVTFTNKATEEMKGRILSDLHDLAEGKNKYGREPAFLQPLTADLFLSPQTVRQRAQEALSKILHDYSRFSVLTIDKFFQRIIRSFMKELNIEADYAIDFDHHALLEMAVDRLMDQVAEDGTLRQWLEQYIRKSVDEGKSWDVRNSLIKLGGSIFDESFDEAAVESNKRTVISFVDALRSETGRVKGEMTALASKAVVVIETNGLSAADFYYGTGGFANYFYKIAKGSIEGFGTRVEAALCENAKWGGSNKAAAFLAESLKPELQPLLKTICSLWEEHKKMFYTASLCDKTFHSFILLTDINRNVIQLCRERNIMLLSQTNALLHRLIADNEAPFIYEKTGTDYSHFMIDEFQDTSAKQWNNFLPLIRNSMAQTESERENIMLVGDVKQSIYRWRGGDWKILGDEAQRQLGDDRVSAEPMTVNWRSRERIVRFNNALVRRCVAIDNAELNHELEKGLEDQSITRELYDSLKDTLNKAYAGMEQEPSAPNRNGEGFVQVMPYRENENERLLIETIGQLQDRGYKASDIAVLVRTNKAAATYANVLLTHKMSNPGDARCFDVVSQEALVLGSSRVVKFLAACMTLAVNPEDAVSLLLFNRFTGNNWQTELTPDQSLFFRSLREQSLQDAFEKLLHTFSLGGNKDDIPFLQAFHDSILSYCEKNTPDLFLFLAWWNEKGSRQAIYLPSQQEAIRILTIHKSKGLQFKAVILPECQWSMVPGRDSYVWCGEDANGRMLLPYEKSMGNSCYAGEYYTETVLSHVDGINMLYVALTRAENELHLMLPDGRANNISTLIDEAIQPSPYDDSTALISNIAPDDSEKEVYDKRNSLEGELTPEGFFRYGTPQTYRHAQQNDPACPVAVNFEAYPSTDFTPKIRTRLESARYFGELSETAYRRAGEGDAADDTLPVIPGMSPPATIPANLSPRDRGVLLHRIFAGIADRTAIAPLLEKLAFDGQIGSRDKSSLQQLIREAFSDPVIASWFEPGWNVLNERRIILPQPFATDERSENHHRRPDRVIVKDRKAVVIDYKFGFVEKETYFRQVKQYMDILQKMGYAPVEGYLWYVRLHKVIAVA